MELIIILLIGAGAIAGVIMGFRAASYDAVLDKSISDKIRELPPIFKRAQASIKMATDFDPKFFEDYRVKDAIEEALKDGVEIQFLCEAEPPIWYREQKEIEIKKVSKLEHHIMVVDNHHVRLERPHEKLQFGRNRSDVALIFYNFPTLAESCRQEFDSLWTKAS